MQPPKPLDPRKRPRQSRALETVEAILEATAHILEREGLEAVSTNRVAQRAGVSIGSLYQYFPGKEALIRAVYERHTTALMDLLRTRFEAAWDAPLPELVRAVVSAMVEAHRVSPRLHQQLMAALPRIGAQGPVQQVEREAAALIARYMQAKALFPQPELPAFLIVQAVEAITHAAVLERPEALNGTALVDETTRMLLAYLEGSGR